MKTWRLISLLLITTSSLSAQNSEKNTGYFFVGSRIHAPVNQLSTEELVGVQDFVETTVGRIAEHGISFQFRIGTDRYKRSMAGDIDMNGGISGNVEESYEANGYYVKPGIVILKKMRKVYGTILLLNTNTTYATHKLSVTLTDQVYGDQTTTYSKHVFYPFSSFELEHDHLFNIGKYIDINLGYFLGFRVVNPRLFGDVIPGYGGKATFVPGVLIYKDVYFNIQTGINVHLY